MPANVGNNSKYNRPDDSALVINQLQARVAALERNARAAPWYSVLIADDATDRDAKIGSPTEGMLALIKGLDQLQAYNGTAWTGLADYLVGTPVFFLTRTSTTACTSGSDATISWENSLAERPDTYWTSGTTVTVPYAGLWLTASYTLFPSGSATGKRQNTIRDAGNAILGAATTTSNNTTDGHPLTAVALSVLAANDTLNVKIFENGGTTLNASGSWFGGFCVRRYDLEV